MQNQNTSMFILGVFVASISILSIYSIIYFIRNWTINRKYNKIYTEIFELIGSKSFKFISRIGDTVSFKLFTKTLGNVELFYFLNKKEVCIFKNNNCLYTIVYADKKIIANICDKIDNDFESEINDCLVILGIAYDKKSLVKLGVDISGVNSDIVQNEKSSKITYTIDDILDRINKVGIDNLNEDEKKFLSNYNKKK